LRLKCTKFTFCLGSAPDPAGGAYSAPRSLPLFKGSTSKGMEGNGRGEEKVKGRKGRGGGRDLAHPKILVWRPLCNVSLKIISQQSVLWSTND